MQHLTRTRSNSVALEPITPMPLREIDSPARTQPLYPILAGRKQNTSRKSMSQLVPGAPLTLSSLGPTMSAMIIAPSNCVDTKFSTSIPITELLKLSQQGDAQAADYLFRVVFGQL